MCSTCKHLLEMDKVPVSRIKPLEERSFFPKKKKIEKTKEEERNKRTKE